MVELNIKDEDEDEPVENKISKRIINEWVDNNNKINELKNQLLAIQQSIDQKNEKPKKPKRTVTSESHKLALAKGREKLAKLRAEKKEALIESKKEIKQKYSGKHNIINKESKQKEKIEKIQEPEEIKPQQNEGTFKKQTRKFVLKFD